VQEFKGNPPFTLTVPVDRGQADGHFAVGGHISLVNPADANGPQVESVIEDFTQL